MCLGACAHHGHGRTDIPLICADRAPWKRIGACVLPHASVLTLRRRMRLGINTSGCYCCLWTLPWSCIGLLAAWAASLAQRDDAGTGLPFSAL